MLDALIIIGIILLVVTIPFIVRLIWNIRLVKFQKRNFIKPSTSQRLSISNNLAVTALLLVFGLFSIVGGSVRSNKHSPQGVPTLITFEEYVANNKLHENAKVFSSREEFNSIFKDISSNYSAFNLRNTNAGFSDFSIDATDAMIPAPSTESLKNSTSDTYEQVMGVSEGDIAKFTNDGKHIIYVNRATQALHKISLNDRGEVVETKSVKLDSSFYFQDMFLHENKIILFSYSYKRTPYISFDETDSIDMLYYPYSYYRHSTTKYSIYNLVDLELAKEGELLGLYQEVRKVDDILYVATNDYVSGNTDDERFYNNVYYFKGKFNSRAITRLYAISLATNDIVSDIGFVGSLHAFYMGNGKIVLTNNRWSYLEDESSWVNESNVIVINYQAGMLEYVGSAVVEGMALEQYYIDVRDDYIRIVTTMGKNNSNALYIFKEDPTTDKLELVSLLNNGLGKPNENVKSVTYTNTQVQIVTFYQTDPLYTIDLTNPKKPKIISVVEEPGFSSSLIVWDEELGFTIGIGYMADNNGRTTGIKISAYNQIDSSPMQTIEFSYSEYGYLWTPALFDQRRNLLVNKDRGVIAFISQGFTDGKTKVLLFNIDFGRKTPIVLNEALFDKKFGCQIDKLMLFNQYIHILGSEGVYTYDTDRNTLSNLVKFELEKEINYHVSFNDEGYFGEVVMYEYEGIKYTRKNVQAAVTSKEELLTLCDEWKNKAFDEASSEYNSALNEALRHYDDAFFQTKNLIIITYDRSTCYEISVGSVTVNNLEFTVNIDAVYTDKHMGDYQTILIEVDKDDVADLRFILKYNFK